jgi:hypothetical protein
MKCPGAWKRIKSVDVINTHSPDLVATDSDQETLTSNVEYKDGHRDIFAALWG